MSLLQRKECVASCIEIILSAFNVYSKVNLALFRPIIHDILPTYKLQSQWQTFYTRHSYTTFDTPLMHIILSANDTPFIHAIHTHHLAQLSCTPFSAPMTHLSYTSFCWRTYTVTGLFFSLFRLSITNSTILQSILSTSVFKRQFTAVFISPKRAVWNISFTWGQNCRRRYTTGFSAFLVVPWPRGHDCGAFLLVRKTVGVGIVIAW
jgi:heat shock protein HspQ